MRSFSVLSLLVCALSAASSAFASPGHVQIQAVHRPHRGVKRVVEKRQQNNARFSWYRTGLGACGGFNVETDMVVALNSGQWDGGAHCGKQITITINGHSESATIVDQCPDCPYGALDFSRGLFSKWTDSPENTGIMYGDWSYGSGPQQPPPTTHQEPTTTSEPPPPPPPTTTSTSSTPPPPPSTTSTSTSTSTSAAPTTTTSTWSEPTTTSSSPETSASSESTAPSSSSAPAVPTGALSESRDALSGLAAVLAAGLSITS